RQTRIPLHAGLLLARNQEVTAAVSRPAVLGLFRADRRLLALADHDETVGADPEADQIRLDGGRAPFPQRQVVLVGPTRVGVTFDRGAHAGPAAEEIRILLQDAALVVLHG